MVEFGLLLPRDQHFVKKGWGYELWIRNTEKYCGKLLFIKKDKKVSWHYHKLKDETFYLHSGELLIFYSWQDDLDKADQLILQPGDIFYVPTGLRHRMQGISDSNLFEFSSQHFDEDSIRLIKGD
jgi:mannose-6-phosphate isomerase-like protein (cupin superfamily)